MHKQNVELQNKQLINENGLKLYNSKQGITVLKETECNSSIDDKIGGVSTLIHKRIRDKDEILLTIKKWFIVTLKCDNFKPPVQLRVKQINIYVRDKIYSISRNARHNYPRYKKHCFINRDLSFYSIIDSIGNDEISFGFELICASDRFQVNLDDEESFTIKGLLEVKSNDLVVSEYAFRTVYFSDNTDKRLKTSVTYLGGEILEFQSEFDKPTKRKSIKRKASRRWYYMRRRRRLFYYLFRRRRRKRRLYSLRRKLI